MVDDLQAFDVHCCLIMGRIAAEGAGYVALPDGLEEKLTAVKIKVRGRKAAYASPPSQLLGTCNLSAHKWCVHIPDSRAQAACIH